MAIPSTIWHRSEATIRQVPSVFNTCHPPGTRDGSRGEQVLHHHPGTSGSLVPIRPAKPQPHIPASPDQLGCAPHLAGEHTAARINTQGSEAPRGPASGALVPRSNEGQGMENACPWLCSEGAPLPCGSARAQQLRQARPAAPRSTLTFEDGGIIWLHYRPLPPE